MFIIIFCSQRDISYQISRLKFNYIKERMGPIRSNEGRSHIYYNYIMEKVDDGIFIYGLCTTLGASNHVVSIKID